MQEWAFLELSPDRYFVGWGPFYASSRRIADRPAFFLPDFDLSDPHRWRHPSSWDLWSGAELRARFDDFLRAKPSIQWSPLFSRSFFEVFQSIQKRIRLGELHKYVPVVFEEGRIRGDVDLFDRHLVARLVQKHESMWAYFFKLGDEAMGGLSPEILFERQGGRLKSMALAGTRKRGGESNERAFLNDPKERAEHDFVVVDIERRLSKFGPISKSSLQVHLLPHLMHLKTDIEVELRDEQASFEDFVRALHPTPALGQSPRGAAREREPGRKQFGAPWGLELPSGESLCLVAIRNVDRKGSVARVGAGCGVVSESKFEREWAELGLKRDSVKRLLDL